VGDRYVIEKMLAEDVVLGGEDSGHMIFRDVHTTGDGMMAALRLIESMNNAGKPLSRLKAIMTVFPQELINVDVQEKPDINGIPEIADVIQKIENELGEQGRVLVRYSGTQNKCRIMVEGPTKKKTQACCQEIVNVVRSILAPPF
jgi:phosphoglucosamine mutase